MIRLLLDRGADINANGNAPLRWAALGSHTTAINMLLMRGANIKEALALAPQSERADLFGMFDACAAAIPAEQQRELLKDFRKKMPALAALVQQSLRRSSRRTP